MIMCCRFRVFFLRILVVEAATVVAYRLGSHLGARAAWTEFLHLLSRPVRHTIQSACVFLALSRRPCPSAGWSRHPRTEKPEIERSSLPRTGVRSSVPQLYAGSQVFCHFRLASSNL